MSNPKSIMRIGAGVNTMPLALALRKNPQLWNQNTDRTAPPRSPHKAVDDIWVRYAKSYKAGQREHDSVWLPPYRVLPMVRDHVFGMMAMVNGERLGGVLITRIPAGHTVQPHQDHGWHAEYYDKIALQVEAHPQQSFNYEDGGLITAPGDIYWFNNQETHWVVNDSPVDRITMIVCIKTDRYRP